MDEASDLSDLAALAHGFEQRTEFGYYLRFLLVEIVALSDVSTEVEKFARLVVRRVVVGLIESDWDFRYGTGFSCHEQPLVVAKRVAVGIGVVHDGAPRARAAGL